MIAWMADMTTTVGDGSEASDLGVEAVSVRIGVEEGEGKEEERRCVVQSEFVDFKIRNGYEMAPHHAHFEILRGGGKRGTRRELGWIDIA